jgi:hypothetical protein
MIFTRSSRQSRAALVHRAAGNGKSGEAFPRAVRGLFGKVVGDDLGVHILVSVIFRG